MASLYLMMTEDLKEAKQAKWKPVELDEIVF